MKKQITFLTVLLLVLITTVVSAGTVNLPRTGQTKCYNTAGTEIPCAGTGQDGEIQAGVAWPEPRFNDNGDGTITDNLTGLMWTKDGNLPGSLKTWYEALDYVDSPNVSYYLGYTDWRLPNVNELESLVHGNEANTATWLNAQGFTNVQADYYWSSTTYAYYPGSAWYVYMWDGRVGAHYESNGHDGYVWPVRAGQSGSFENSVISLPQTGQTVSYAQGDDGDLERGVSWPVPRFTDHGNGTVTDNLTGLMWTKNANLPNCTRTWQEALDYVQGMNAGAYPNLDYADWRLPNRKELHSLTDFSRYSPALPAGHPFTSVLADDYWSSTTYAYNPGNAWVVWMWNGYVYADAKSKYDSSYVWPVRGPVEPTLITLSSFTATTSDRAVILKWTTASEIDNAGFNLYRAESENGEYVKINASMIPAKGSPTQGASYQFVDENVQNRKTYSYKLEDIDIYGKSTMHGPVSVEVKRFGVRD